MEARRKECYRLLAREHQKVLNEDGSDLNHAYKMCMYDVDQLAVLMLLDLEEVKLRVEELHQAFEAVAMEGQEYLHTFAAKANPVTKVLELVHSLGMGVEAASRGEVMQAQRAGVPSSSIVFDSPAKTKQEIRMAVNGGIPLNVDNFQELVRVAAAVEKTGRTSVADIGVRINPQVGAGTMAGFSTGTRASKFGIPLEEAREELLEAFARHPFLNMVHCHVGSQGCDFSLMMKGLRRTVDFALEVNKKAGKKQVEVVDVGGGLPVNFTSDEVVPTFAQYVEQLHSHVPELFDGTFKVITEFGRAIVAKAGVTFMHVEYTKESGGRHYATVQSGTEMFIRTVYHPEKWPLRVKVLDAAGVEKSGPEHEYDIAGPCCLGMDIIAHQRPLPEIAPGDYLVFHDTGGYYHSSFSHYNSRQAPPMLGYKDGADGKVELVLLKAGQSLEESLAVYA